MNKFERWIFLKLLEKVLQQGNHARNLRQIHVDIRNIWRKNFYEDNVFTTDDHLREIFEGTQYISTYNHNVDKP